jgi:membrane protease subunit (stomatin/prohibitin family)
MVSFFQVECPKCNAKNKSGARFCGNCGAGLPGAERKCGNCGATVAAEKSFCGNCGKPLSESAAPLMTGNRWARRADDFAAKVEVDDVEGFFKRGLIVEAGTKAIFFVNGAYSGILDPGKYDMGGLLQKIKNVFSSKTTTAVLVDTGDVELQFLMGDLPTKDPLRLTAECRMVVQMDNPTQFFENMMKGRQNYSISEIKTFLESELHNCLREFISSRTVEELSSNLTFKQQMEQGVAQHLATTFNRKGLSFVQVRVFNFRHPRTDALTSKKEEYWLNAQDLQTTLDGEGSIMGLDRKLMNQETAKAIMQLEVYQERAKVFEAMRKAVASNQMNQVVGENDLEKFMQTIDKDKILRADEMRTLVQDFSDKKEDRDLARTHLIQRLRIEQNADLARGDLAGKLSLQSTVSDFARTEEMKALDNKLEEERKVLAHKQAQEWANFQMQIDAKKASTLGDIELQKAQAGADVDVYTMKTDAETAAGKKSKLSQIELDEIEAKSGIGVLREMKAAKAEDAARELERKLREREGESKITMSEEDQRHARELQKIQALSTLSTEALIAAAPADRAAMLTELKRTEGLKGFSEEQILAMAADKSPEVAKAFQEKFRNSSAADVAKAYERMIAMKDQSTTELKEMSRENAKMMQEMFNRGMETQRDTAMAAARSGQPTTTVIPAGSGIVQTGTGSSGGYGQPGIRSIGCPECHLQVQEGQKFCDNCGHKFF